MSVNPSTNPKTKPTDTPKSVAHPSKTDVSPTEQPQPEICIHTSFDSMSLQDPLLRGIYSFGFEQPSPIQQKAIVPIAAGGDVIVQVCCWCHVVHFIASVDHSIHRVLA